MGNIPNKAKLKKALIRWAKCYNDNSQTDYQFYYDVQMACLRMKISFDEVEKYMAGKKSKFNPDTLS